MADAIFKDSFPDLTELENKVGRKTPESLLSWMRDVAEGGDQVLGCDVNAGGDCSSAVTGNVSDKINHLKEEMRRLRCADVRILWQLVSVHEGIETMRWFMEDRGALASRGSSLMGSLSSLVAMEEQGPWTYPCRESPSPTCPQNLTESTEKEPERMRLSLTDDGDSSQESNVSTINYKSEGRLPRSPSSGVSWYVEESHAQQPTNTASNLSQTQGLEASPLKSTKSSAKTIKRVLLRSSRKEVTARTSGSIFTTQSEETQRDHQTRGSFKVSLDNTDNATSSVEENLLQDAQWNWMESQDEVTFL